jgi:hypothetical protein
VTHGEVSVGLLAAVSQVEAVERGLAVLTFERDADIGAGELTTEGNGSVTPISVRASSPPREMACAE